MKVGSLLAVPLLVATGCDLPAGDREGHSITERTGALGTTYTVSISLPVGLAPDAVAIGMSDSMAIGDRTQIKKTPAGFAAVANTGANLTTLGRDAKVGDVWSRGQVTMGPNSRVEGSVRSPTNPILGAGSTVTGGIVVQPITATATTWDVVFPDTSRGDVTVVSGPPVTLTPGRSGKVSAIGSSATLVFKTGTYYLDSLELLGGARLNVDTSGGPIIVYVVSRVFFSGPLVRVAGTDGNLLVAYLGTQPVTMAPPFSATVVAPGAEIRTGTGSASGAFFAKRIVAGPDFILSHIPFKGFSGVVPSSDDRPRVLFVAGSTALGGALDQAMRERIEQLGFVVEVKAAASTVASDASGRDLVLISDSAGNVGSKFRDASAPVIVLEEDVLDDMGLTGSVAGTDFGNVQAQSQIDIVGAGSLLAAGLGGRVPVSNRPSKVVWGKPGIEALKIATVAGEPSRFAIFAYESGSQMPGIRAPARRVGWFAGQSPSATLTIDGWLLFDAAIRWAVQPSALFVVGATPLAPGDAALKARLERNLGLKVDVRLADQSLASDASGKRVIVISESSSSLPSANLGGKFVDATAPIVALDPVLYDALEMTAPAASNGHGDAAGQTQLDISAAAIGDPLAAGLVDAVAATSAPHKFGWGNPLPWARRVARLVGATDRWGIFGYDKGAFMSGIAAPDRRVGFFASRDAVAGFTPAGWKLFDASIRWASRLIDPLNPCSGRVDGTSCSDDNPCNGVEVCQQSRCIAGPVNPSDPAVAQCNTSTAGTIEWRDSPVRLVATRTCAPLPSPGRVDGQAIFPAPVSFEIPKEIPLILGNAGNQTATLSFRRSSGALVTCQYAGGAAVAHPTSPLEIARGRKYGFTSCSDGSVAGATAAATQFTLSVVGGDCQDPPFKTIAELNLGQGGCGGPLETPISPEESILIRDSFAWANTTPVLERDLEGRPNLYYALIYLEEREQAALLDTLLIHHSTMPLFEVERKRWQGRCGRMSTGTDGQGAFVYALMPGITYNQLRQYALQPPDPVDGHGQVFRVVKLLSVPDFRVMRPDGSISFDGMADAGFRYMGLDDFPADDDTEVHQFPFLSKLGRVAGKIISTVVRGAVRETVSAFGEIDRFFAGSVTLHLDLTILNRDLAFKFGGQTGSSMTRGWGLGAGQELPLPGVRVEIDQWTAKFIPTKFYARTRSDGTVSIRIAKNRGALRDICIGVGNSDVTITDAFTENRVCSFSTTTPIAVGSQDMSRELRTDRKELHVLNQLADSQAYIRQVVRPPSSHHVEVLDGWHANQFASFGEGGALAPCFDFVNLAADVAIQAVALAVSALYAAAYGPAAGPIVYGIIIAESAILAVDMILPNDYKPVLVQGRPLQTIDRTFDSRGLVVHEHGHFALCGLLYDRFPTNITVAYTGAIVSRIRGGSNPPSDAEAGYVNEAFADFFAGQVVGGTNYFDPNFESTTTSPPMNFCRSVEPGRPCLDSNLQGTSTFHEQVARLATIFHDAFDGHGQRLMSVPNDGDAWRLSGDDLVFSEFPYGDARDETIAMPGSCLYRMVSNWDDRGELITDESFLAGLADAMKEPGCGGNNWCEICHLFALHDAALPAGATPQEKFLHCNQGYIRSRIGAAPADPRNLLQTTCGACPSGQATADGITCVTCPPGERPVPGGCAPCPPGEILEGGVCRPCSSHQVSDGGLCRDCLRSQIVQNNMCTDCPPGLYRRFPEEVCDTCPPTGVPGDWTLYNDGTCGITIP